MYVPNELNTHLPSDKLADNGKGFFQVTNKESISTTPLSAEYYKPSISLKNENYSFGFKFEANGIDSLIVLKVIKTSPAEKAGFLVGDEIISVGKNFSNNIQQYKDLLQEPNARIQVIIKRNAALETKLLKTTSIL